VNAYRFVVFPPGVAPTAEELAAFRGYSDLLERHVAYGKGRRTGGLAICCEAEPFDRLRGLEPAFDELLTKWSVRGAEVHESTPFCRDDAAWKRIKSRAPKARTPAAPPKNPPAKAAAKPKGEPTTPPPELRREPRKPTPEERRVDARQAEGLGRLAIERSARRGRAYEWWAKALPYVLWAVAAAAVLAAGGYVAGRLLGGLAERRSETIERVADDAISEPLTRPPRAADSN